MYISWEIFADHVATHFMVLPQKTEAEIEPPKEQDTGDNFDGKYVMLLHDTKLILA